MSDGSTQVVAIVLVYGTTENLEECLASLQSQTHPFAAIMVVDNGSPCPVNAEISRRWPGVLVRRNERNLGYAGGNNRAMREALSMGAEYLFLANDDTRFAPEMLEKLLAACEADASVGAAGPTVLYYDRPEIVHDRGRVIDPVTTWERCRDAGVHRDEGDHRETEVYYLTGCGLLLRSRALRQVGLFDERFYLYAEEMDLCRRMARCGYRILCVPDAEMWHKGSQTMNQSPALMKEYYRRRNRWLTLTKSGSARQARREARRELRVCLELCVHHWRRRQRLPDNATVCLAAATDYLLGRFGPAPRWLRNRLAAEVGGDRL